MRTVGVLLLVVVAACSSSDESMKPFTIPTWRTLPTDDQLVAAVLGDGHQLGPRAVADAIVRDLALPTLHEHRDLKSLGDELEHMRDHFESSTLYQDPLYRLLRLGVAMEMTRLKGQALALAERRVHDVLWPNEPMPELWWHAEVDTQPSTDAVIAAASKLERRLHEVESRYGLEQFSDGRQRAAIVNYVHVAKTGDYSWTGGSLYQVLRERGVATNARGDIPDF